jgi:hypothetical protein
MQKARRIELKRYFKKCIILVMVRAPRENGGEQDAQIFERKIFRRIYGPKYENGEWKSRTNRELEATSKG